MVEAGTYITKVFKYMACTKSESFYLPFAIVPSGKLQN